jgi:protein SCO1
MTPAWRTFVIAASIGAMVLLADTAMANFTRAELNAVSAVPPPHAALPLGLLLRDEDQRQLRISDAIAGVPAIVIFADYTCRTLCGPIVSFVAAGLAKSGLKPGVEYHLLVIGLNPRNGVSDARAMRTNHLGTDDPVGWATSFLTADEPTIHLATTALGLRYAYDPQHDQYAHPAAAYIVDSAGQVRRLLSPLGLDGNDLRLAIVDAGRGSVGTLADRIHLLCYGYDPARGIYTERITIVLGYAAGLTLLLLAAVISTMLIRKRRRAAQ